jgi:hypothetical protein
MPAPRRRRQMNVIQKAVEVLKEKLTEDELVELASRLDSDPSDPILDGLNEHLAVVRPELFGDMEDE